jgi:2-iminoacetate synthase
MATASSTTDLPPRLRQWASQVIKQDEIDRYLDDGQCFIDEGRIWRLLEENADPGEQRIRDIIEKSRELQRLEPDETAALLHCRDEGLWQEIYATGLEIKQKVYGRRIVFFAPLYLANLCVNNCTYCGYRRSNDAIVRKRLSMEELRAEVRALVAKGHKRLIMVYGEHPSTGVDYIAESIRVAYDTKVGPGEIRRANVNAAPMCIDDLRKLRDVGIGTFQVFQETYHRPTYEALHPRHTIKGNYLWRLYALHRAQDAGVDDVAIGALFGLFDYRFEVMGLLMHAIDLERRFDGVGPHTISFPRLEPAVNTPWLKDPAYKVTDDQFKKLVAVLRLSVPYTGMILTCREPAELRREVIGVGCTQIDAGSNIAIGGYAAEEAAGEKQQFMLSDNRSLDDAIRDLAEMGMITSFCTAGYRCGRTGQYFMNIAKAGKVHCMCMPNAILTFQEYLNDYASPGTRAVGEKLVKKEIGQLPTKRLRDHVRKLLRRVNAGERDVYV